MALTFAFFHPKELIIYYNVLDCLCRYVFVRASNLNRQQYRRLSVVAKTFLLSMKKKIWMIM